MKPLHPILIEAGLLTEYRTLPGRIASVLAITIGCLGAELPTDNLADLQDQLQRELSGSTASPTIWGALVMRNDGTQVFGTNTHHPFIPASNTKLFIGAMALDQLGPEAQLHTPVHVSRPPDADGVLRSDLWILGQGDPSLGTAPRSGNGNNAGTWDEALVSWVTQWQSKGLRRVIGDLVMCDAAVQIPEYGPGWDDEDRAEWYGAPVSAFVVNDNTFRLVASATPLGATSIPVLKHPPLPCLAVDWRVLPGTNTTHRIHYERRLPGGPIEFHGRFATGTNGWSAELAIANPAQVFGELLKRTLERRGIPISGSVRVVHATNGCPTTE